MLSVCHLDECYYWTSCQKFDAWTLTHTQISHELKKKNTRKRLLIAAIAVSAHFAKREWPVPPLPRYIRNPKYFFVNQRWKKWRPKRSPASFVRFPQPFFPFPRWFRPYADRSGDRCSRETILRIAQSGHRLSLELSMGDGRSGWWTPGNPRVLLCIFLLWLPCMFLSSLKFRWIQRLLPNETTGR